MSWAHRQGEPGLVDEVALEPRFTTDEGRGRLFALSSPHPGVIGFGISEDSAIETSPGRQPVASSRAAPAPLSSVQIAPNLHGYRPVRA
jgi:hypothetical protein